MVIGWRKKNKMDFNKIKARVTQINWNLYGKRTLIVLRVLLLLLLESAAIVLITQKFQMNGTNLALIWAIEHKRIFMVTTLTLLLFGVALDALFSRFWVSNTIFVVVGVVFAYANQQKMLARDAPLLPSDLIFIKEPTEMMKMADGGSLSKVIIGLIVLFVVTLLLEIFLTVKWPNKKQFWVVRAVVLASCIFIFSGLFKLNDPNSRAKKVSDWMGNTQEFWNPAVSATRDGTFLTFANYLGNKVMDKPRGYNQKTMVKIADKYKKQAQVINRTRRNSNINKQTLIYVLSESYSDPRRVPGLQVNQNPMPEMDKIKQQTTSGLMLSPGYGGGTANIEYSVETGWNLQSFAPSMTTPFSQLVIRKNYNPNITNLFKRKNAIHPYLGTFYERRQAYEKLGFQTFRTLDGKKADQKLKYQKKIQRSGFVGDDEAYKNVYWQLDHEKKGQFINLATMQNHLGYGDKYYKYPFAVSGKAVASPQNATEINHYTRGLSLTSHFTAQFLKKLDTYQRPITVVWYGDHLPGIYNGVNMAQNYIALHETDYFIYSNAYARKHGYGSNKQTNGVQVVGPNGFTPLALKQMKQKVNPFYALMTEVQAKLPAQVTGNGNNAGGLMVNHQSQSVSKNSLSKSQKQLIRDYELVQYDNTAGKGYLKSLNFMK